MQQEVLVGDDLVDSTQRTATRSAGFESIRVGDIELDPERRTVKSPASWFTLRRRNSN